MQEPTVVQEIKPIKRIGILAWFEGEAGRRLEALVKAFPEVLDTKRYSRADRLRLLAHLGIVPTEQRIFENLTPTVGFEALVKAMTGNAASLAEIEVNVHALGDDNTAAVAGDTTLGNETTRALLSSTSYNGNKAYYTAFYGLAEAIGTHEEMGLFINGDAGTPDDGVLWDRTLTTIVKTGVQSLTIDYEDEFTNA